MYREMLTKITDKIAESNGPSIIESITVGDVIELDVAKIDVIEDEIRQAEAPETGNETIIQFVYADQFDTFKETRGAKGNEQFTNEECLNAILTLAGKRYRKRGNDSEKQASWEASFRLLKSFDEELKRRDARALITVDKGSDAISEWFDASIRGVDRAFEIILPRSYTDETTTLADGTQLRLANNLWRETSEGGEALVLDGVTIGYSFNKNGSRFFKVAAAPMDIFDAAGKLNSDHDVANYSSWIEEIVRHTLSELVETTGVEVTDEDRSLYSSARVMLSMIRASIKDSEAEAKELEERMANTREKIKEEMSKMIARQREIETSTERLTILRSSSSDKIAKITGAILEDFEKIKAEECVKSCTLEGQGSDMMMKVALHPIVVDCGEEEERKSIGEELAEARGPAHYRLLSNIAFTINMTTGSTHVDDILRFDKLPSGVLDERFNQKVHPHITDEEEGRACWGDLSTVIAQALATREWHTAVQWVFNYCGTIRNDAAHWNITRHWTYPPAPEGMEPGWVLPGTDRAAMLEGYNPEPTYK